MSVHIQRIETTPKDFQYHVNLILKREWKYIVVRLEDRVEIHGVYKGEDGTIYDSVVETLMKKKEEFTNGGVGAELSIRNDLSGNIMAEDCK